MGKKNGSNDKNGEKENANGRCGECSHFKKTSCPNKSVGLMSKRPSSCIEKGLC